MRWLVFLVVIATSSIAVADRESQKNPPCTCIRPPDVAVERIGNAKRDEHAGYVESRIRTTHGSVFERCLREHKTDHVDVIVRYARGAEMPKLKFAGAPGVVACVAKLTWSPMIAAPRAITYRYRVALSSARR